MRPRVTTAALQRLVAELQPKAVVQLTPSTPSAVLGAPQLFQHLTDPRSTLAETPEEIAKLKSALAALSPDVPRGQGKLYEPGESTPSKDYWLLVIWAIASLGWTCGEELAREWSMRSARYTEEGFEAAWNSYDPAKPQSVGIGSLYSLAKYHGWAQPGPSPQPIAANDTRYRLYSPAEIRASKPSGYRLKNVLPDRGVAALFGGSGSGKTFFALGMGAAISKGDKWFEIRTTQAPVVYAAFEGEGGLPNRLNALEMAQGSLPEGQFFFFKQSFDLLQQQDVEALAATVPKGAVVFIDTLNRAAPGADENSSVDMGKILQSLKLLQTRTDGLVVIVHHTGKDASKGLRGHSSLHAALDAAIEIERTDAGRFWKVAKSKDGEDGQTIQFQLERHVLGQDSDGDDITSCSVGPALASLFTKPPPKGQQQRDALKALRTALAGITPPTKSLPQCPFGTPYVGLDEAIDAIAVSLGAIDKHKRRNRARTLLDSLTRSGHVQTAIDSMGDSWFWV